MTRLHHDRARRAGRLRRPLLACRRGHEKCFGWPL